MTSISGRHILLAAGIIGVAAVIGSLILAQSIDEAAIQIDRVATEIGVVSAAIGEAKEALAAAPAPSRGAQPDPNTRYEVNIEGAPSVGPDNAAVTLVAFSDFQCPFCARVLPTIEQIRKTYGDQVRVVFKHLPLSMHAKAPAAHAAAEAAFRQGKFWEMHDKIFANQKEMAEERYLDYAAELGLDIDQFKRDLESETVQARIDLDTEEAAELGATGTPSFFLNGRKIQGALPFESFKKGIEQELEDAG
jgi:protein-disulfide isomerase